MGSDLKDLLERMDRATGPDRQLDWDTHEVLTGEVPEFHACERYTASVDGALALVERVLPGWAYMLCRPHLIGPHVLLWPDNPDKSEGVDEEAATLPLAILAALLRAKLTEPPQ